MRRADTLDAQVQRLQALRKGDLVKLKGRGEKLFRYLYVTINPRGEPELTLYGPVRKDGKPHEAHQAFVVSTLDKVR